MRHKFIASRPFILYDNFYHHSIIKAIFNIASFTILTFGAHMKLNFLVISTFSLIAFSNAAHAQEQDKSDAPITVTAEVGTVSDYRFRGISLSGKDPAVQGGITVSTKPGFYVNAWASTIADYEGAKTEIDLAAGWSGPVGPLNADVNVVGYLYPGGEAVNYYEIAGSLSKEFGPFGTKVGVAYSPKQDNIGGVANTYVYGEANYAITGTPVTVNARAGYEDGVYTSKKDYAIGANLEMAPFTLGLSYVTVDGDPVDELDNTAGDTVVVSLKANF